ncbi:MAG: DUF294 nucleotidyltransferase-like domain-containing protein [Desulfuromonadaceae bacterium]|nr:DUF294 nucleotidyltransferase-like domain-containing protein [Desulfuromonadaceae bacterium]
MPDRDVSSCIYLDLYQEIEDAGSIGQLHAIGTRMLDIMKPSITRGDDTKNIVRLISGLNDAITTRLITLLDSSEGIRLPEGATFFVLGSEGRSEQTLRTDQDSAIVYIDNLQPEKCNQIKRFATRLVDALEEIGVPPCPGKIMASNPQWCHSISEWKELLDNWISTPTPENMLNFGMLHDLRPLHGDEALGRELCSYICSVVHRYSIFFPNMAAHVVRFPPPLTIFGQIRIEHDGEQKGKVDIKKAGIFAISAGASLLSLEAGMIGGNTWEKLEFLGGKRIITQGDLASIDSAYTFLTQLRLQRQLQLQSVDGNSSNYIDLHIMTDGELDQFLLSLRGVKTFLGIFRTHYLLDYISI